MAAIPKANSNKLKEVLAGYDKVAEAGEVVSDEEVGEARNVGEDTARRQKKFLCEIDVIKNGHDYRLTEEGQQLGKYIRFNQDDQARESLRALLDDYEPIPELLSHIDSDGIEHDNLVDKVGFVTESELTTSRKKSGAEAIVELLEWTDFITSDEEDIFHLFEGNESSNESESSESSSKTAANSQGAINERQAERSRTNEVDSNDRTLGVQSGAVDIQLELTGDEDPENVRKIILAARKGLQQDISKHDSSETTT